MIKIANKLMEYSFHYNVSKPMNFYSKNIKQSLPFREYQV